LQLVGFLAVNMGPMHAKEEKKKNESQTTMSIQAG
jgi:hypothetical protein